MATDTKKQVTWGGANTNSIASGASATSDAVTISDGVFQLTAQIKVDNDSTVDQGDTMEFVFLLTLGDVDADGGGDEYTTELHSYSVVLDTNQEDPAISLVQLPVPIKSLQIVINNNGNNSMTASAIIMEQA